jgi:hypothetical protein
MPANDAVYASRHYWLIVSIEVAVRRTPVNNP